MELLQAISSLYNYRGEFSDVAVPRDDLQTIVQAGLQASAAMNVLSTSYVIVDDPQKLARLSQLFAALPSKDLFRTAPAVLVACVDRQVQESGRATYAVSNYGSSVQNTLLAATSLGYACHRIEGWVRVEGAVAAVVALLGLPDEIRPQGMIPVGVPAQQGQVADVRPFDGRAWWNEYHA